VQSDRHNDCVINFNYKMMKAILFSLFFLSLILKLSAFQKGDQLQLIDSLSLNLRYCAFVRHKDLMKLLKRWHSPVLGLGLVLVDITVAARDNPSCSNSDINKHQP